MNSLFRRAAKRLPSGWRRWFGSLRTQLIFWNVLAVSLLLGGLGIICRFITLSYMLQSVDREMERRIGMFQRPHPAPPPFDRGGRGPHGSDYERDNHGPPPLPPGGSSPYGPRLFYALGEPEIKTDTIPPIDKDSLTRALHGETVWTTITVDGDPVRVLSAPGYDHERRPGAVQNAYSLKEVYVALSGIDTALLLLIPVGLLGAGWVGVALTNRVLKRVQRMTHAAGRIGATDFTRRLPVSGNDEFSELAETFNGLLGRLDAAFSEQKELLQLQRRFTADASHELKTPLTIIKGRAGLAMGRASTDDKSRCAFEEIGEAADTMSQLVQDLLLLARSDEGQMGSNPVEMLAREVLESARRQAQTTTGVPIQLNIEPEDLCITGNEGELTRLFRNLMDNAVLYTPADGKITVTARKGEERIVIKVQDTGIGIAPEHLPHLGERFYRVDASRTRPTGGTGLGLSICRGIVKAHGGTLEFASVPGEGTTVIVTLPDHLQCAEK